MSKFVEKPANNLHISIFFKYGKPHMEIKYDDIEVLEELEQMIRMWMK